MLEHLAEQEILLFLVKMSLASLVKFFFFNRMLGSSPSFFHRVSVLSIACTKGLFLSFVIPTADWSVRVCMCTRTTTHTKMEETATDLRFALSFYFFFPLGVRFVSLVHLPTLTNTHHHNTRSLSLSSPPQKEGGSERASLASKRLTHTDFALKYGFIWVP